jgi:hypothetical protein
MDGIRGGHPGYGDARYLDAGIAMLNTFVFVQPMACQSLNIPDDVR